MHYYETKGKEEATPASQYAKGMQALSNMDRIQQVEMLQGIVNFEKDVKWFSGPAAYI